jgi:ribulose-phosphate 3-epimerase
MPQIKIAPSILSADFARLGEQVAAAEAGGADVIHVDVMDGQFVPNITIGPLVVRAVKRATALPLDVHLMIESPERYVKAFIEAGADTLSVHVEACPHLHRVLQQIREAGARPGVVLNPHTPPESMRLVLGMVEHVLVMTVNPGFGGQAFIPETLPKITWVRERFAGDIAVDGGINAKTALRVVDAGANFLIAGSAVYGAQGSIADAIQALRNAAEGHGS